MWYVWQVMLLTDTTQISSIEKKKYPDKIIEIKADEKWEGIKQVQINSHQQLRQWIFLTFIKWNNLVARLAS